MLNDVYNKRILELAANIPRLGRLPEPDASATALSKLCGSTVTVDLKMDGDTITDFAHEVKACALGQASASVLGREAIGASVHELESARDQFRAMLKAGGPAPDGRFADLAMLAPVKDYPARHASTLLAFEAVCEAVRRAMARTSPAGAA
jgi:NifU-like protein involved in Fe-S cluster formation